MTAAEIVSILRNSAGELHTRHVREVWLFGSAVRGGIDAPRDVDVLVDFDAPVTLLDLVRLRWFLESLLGVPVDVGTRDALKPLVRDRILGEAIRAI